MIHVYDTIDDIMDCKIFPSTSSIITMAGRINGNIKIDQKINVIFLKGHSGWQLNLCFDITNANFNSLLKGKWRSSTWFKYYIKKFTTRKASKGKMSLTQKKLKELARISRLEFARSKKISMSIVVTVCKNKFCICCIFHRILFFGRKTKFLLVIILTGNVFCWNLWISEYCNKLLPLNIVMGLPISPLGMLWSRN